MPVEVVLVNVALAFAGSTERAGENYSRGPNAYMLTQNASAADGTVAVRCNASETERQASFAEAFGQQWHQTT